MGVFILPLRVGFPAISSATEPLPAPIAGLPLVTFLAEFAGPYFVFCEDTVLFMFLMGLQNE